MNISRQVICSRRDECLTYEEFEKKYGIDISNPIVNANDEIGGYRPSVIPNNNIFNGSNGYMGSFIFELDIINEFLRKNIKNISRYTFIDIGCGKGKVNIYNEISNMNYKKNIGIEIDPDFYNIALKNNKKFPNIIFINEDVLNIKISNEPTIYFFYQPFTYKVYQKFFNKNKKEILKNNSIIINIFPYKELDNFYPNFDLHLFSDFNKIFSYEYISIYSSQK